DQITSKRLDERIGFHPSCLVTEVGRNGTMMARDENNIPIVVKGEHKLLGSFVDIVSEKSGPTYLIGKVQ
ncbi:MAG: TRAM domain-containing protein, partial [Candidatus Thermoplasmatota archaeon]|nr:TRAM domain-containing protein [Candidatus Thermoplasmatota archaeon]